MHCINPHRTGETKYVKVPYLVANEDGTESLCAFSLNFRADHGLVDNRRIKREIRKLIWRQLDRRLHSRELRSIMKYVVVLREAT